MAEKDQGAKAVIQLRPADWIAYALPGAEFEGPLETDVATEPQLLLDTLYRARYHGIACAVHIEIQAALDKTMPRRMFLYGSRAMGVHGLPVISVVLWLHSKGRVPASPYQVWVDDRLVVNWHFINIEVRKLSASAMITSGPLGLLPFVPFMQGANEQVAEQAMRRVKEQAPEDEAKTLGFVMAVFIAEVFHSELLAWAIVRRIFMSIDLFKESPLYQSLVKQAKEEGMAQGMAQGMREIAQSALESRLGPLSAEILQALSTADEATLKAVVASNALEQVRQHLGLEPQG